MKYFILLTAFFFFSCKGNEPQKKAITQRQPCDLEFLVHLENETNLTDYEVFEFLESFSGTECQNNVEYSEYRSEVLLLQLNTRTSVFLNKLDKVSPQARSAVLKELSSPVIDIDMPALAKKVGNTNAAPKTKSEVIAALLKNAS
ncbi:hypothetical protein FUA48_11695 [Flavobacterium alkalisoli]|uniref:Uncharacterized protein n=1 Tax=Flavobacterium alkalisoli TaxID=2602769 RepID=A0A5B9FZL5_9FLAO|nr:hypothetical protein [Flavobacterium alkalisoli]QEE50217.1 hypothetical protein FUA48_11695 [Flavobacterium alkalisoli]